jgi:hypothetical protein
METSINDLQDKAAFFDALDDWNWLILGLFDEHWAFREVLEYFVSHGPSGKVSEIEIEIDQLENKLCVLESGVQYAIQRLNELKPILFHGLACYSEEDLCEEADPRF